MLLTDFTTEVLEDVPHSPKTVIERHILRTMQDFCQRTRIWIADLDDVTIVGGTDEYTLVVPAQTDTGANALANILIGIHEIKDENDIPFVDYDYADGIITLRWIPNAGFTLSVVGDLKPDFTADAGPDILKNFYFDGIVAGAKYRLQRMKDKEWSDPAEAQRNLTIYNQQITRCRINRNNQFGSKQLERRPTGW